MNFHSKQTPEPDPNITPLIDVVFLLLIFFMVSTTFTHETQIKLDLPEADAEARALDKNYIDVTIDAQGGYYINQLQPRDNEPKTLKAVIKKALKQINLPKRQLPFVISSDAKTPHQAVVTIMNVASQMGFSHITFVTKEPTETN